MPMGGVHRSPSFDGGLPFADGGALGSSTSGSGRQRSGLGIADGLETLSAEVSEK